MFRFKFITTLFVVLSLACNISVLQAKLIEKSSKKTPDWIGKNFEDKKKLYFSGASTQSSFDKARQLAINDALTQVTQSLDLTMSVNTQHIISDTGIFLDEKTKTKTRAVRLLDTKIKDIYYERYKPGFYRRFIVFEPKKRWKGDGAQTKPSPPQNRHK